LNLIFESFAGQRNFPRNVSPIGEKRCFLACFFFEINTFSLKKQADLKQKLPSDGLFYFSQTNL
jgi:hypothetical protein